VNRREQSFGERPEEAALRIGGMRGEECARGIEGSIGLIGGVRVVRVPFTTRSGRVLFDAARVQDWQFERAVRVMGFELERCERLGAGTSGGWAGGAAPTGPRDPGVKHGH
jgi:copper chaperone CopZ